MLPRRKKKNTNKALFAAWKINVVVSSFPSSSLELRPCAAAAPRFMQGHLSSAFAAFLCPPFLGVSQLCHRCPQRGKKLSVNYSVGRRKRVHKSL